MKIGFIWQCPYPWDIRLEKIMKACIQNGHRLSLLCRGKHRHPESECLNGIEVRRVFPPKLFRAKWAARVAAFPFFLNPVWVAAVIRFLRDEKPDLLIVRDLPLALLVGAIGKMFRVPMILDMAENYPAALVAYSNPFYKPFLFRNAWLARQYENLSLTITNHTLVVTAEQARRLEGLGVERQKLTVISNTPEECFFAPQTNVDSAPSEQTNGKRPNLLFIGKLDAHRGVDLLIRAMPALHVECSGLTLTLVGDGTERERLERLAKSLGLDSSVHMTGWVEFRTIWTYIEKSTVCLIPHLRSQHTETTLPNKLFDYMALGKPVVASNCAPMRRVIEETNCGVTFESGDVADLQRAVRKLLGAAEARITMGRNGQRAVREKYNWGVEERALLKVIDGVLLDTRAKVIVPHRHEA